MAAGSLEKLRILRIVDDVDDSREGRDDPFRYGTAVDVGEHADRRAVDQDVAALGMFEILVIHRIGTNSLDKGVKFCLGMRMTGYDGNRLGTAIG